MTNAYRAAGPPPAVDAGRLWVGGLATALVAALTAAVGVLIATGLLDVDVLAPPGFTGSVIGDYAIAAAIAALLATALIHLLLVASPRPLAFFHWIIGLLIIVVTLLPFASAARAADQARNRGDQPGGRNRDRLADLRHCRPGRPHQPRDRRRRSGTGLKRRNQTSVGRTTSPASKIAVLVGRHGREKEAWAHLRKARRIVDTFS